jgi:formylglycine-generating enzyme required for sulfatase activity
VYCFGDDENRLVDFAWFNKNASDAGEPYAHQVGQKLPNAWGLFDMHGNVWEWCRDIFADVANGDPQPPAQWRIAEAKFPSIPVY